MIQVAFYKGKGTWFDWLVRTWTRSPYSHCEAVLAHCPTGANELRVWSSSPRDNGVRSRVIAFNPAHWDVVDVPWANETLLAEAMGAFSGLKYDWLGIFGTQVLNAGLHSPNRLTCSEACAAALGLSNGHRLSPHQLYHLIKDINRLKEVPHAD